jgi:hypothetical protein
MCLQNLVLEGGSRAGKKKVSDDDAEMLTGSSQIKLTSQLAS